MAKKEVGGGRSAGIGGATAEEMADYHEEGLTTERKIKRGDYGGPGIGPSDPMPPPPPKASVKKLAKGGVTRADGCVRKGHTKGRMV